MQKSFRVVTLLCMIAEWWTYVRNLSKPIECTTAGGNPIVNYGLCRARFISNNKYPILVGDVDNGRFCSWVEAGVHGNSTPTQFGCEPKTLLKNKVY